MEDEDYAIDHEIMDGNAFEAYWEHATAAFESVNEEGYDNDYDDEIDADEVDYEDDVQNDAHENDYEDAESHEDGSDDDYEDDEG